MKDNAERRSQKAEVGRRRIRRDAIVPLLTSAFCLLPAALLTAAPRQEDVFRSIQTNLGERTDPTKLLAVACALAGLVIVVILISRVRQREAVAKPLNHQGKLMRELQKQVSLKPAEMRQLKTLAEGQPVNNPLTLLLCPSLLVKAAKEKPDKFDRKIVANMVKRIGG
jgi:hypothetical protein